MQVWSCCCATPGHEETFSLTPGNRAAAPMGPLRYVPPISTVQNWAAPNWHWLPGNRVRNWNKCQEFQLYLLLPDLPTVLPAACPHPPQNTSHLPPPCPPPKLCAGWTPPLTSAIAMWGGWCTSMRWPTSLENSMGMHYGTFMTLFGQHKWLAPAKWVLKIAPLVE